MLVSMAERHHPYSIPIDGQYEPATDIVSCQAPFDT